MAVAFRNLALTADAPVQQWPVEAVLTAIERGGLSEWRRLAAAIADEPWGVVARRTEQALELTEAYGVPVVMRSVIASARDAAAAQERAEVAAEVRALIAASGGSASQFAARIGTSPSRLSTYANGRVTPSAALMLRMRRAGGSA